METPQQRIENEVKQALKAQDKERLSTLRLLLNAIKNERIRTGEEVDDQTFLSLVRKGLKQRLESSEQFRQGDRPELAEKEEREAEILKTYLPPEISDRQIQTAIREFVAAEGLAGPQAIGQVMQEMIQRFAGSADGATINRLARDILSENS